MARKDGFIRLVQKRMPQGATPSVPLSDDHTDGTWTYKDLYDGEISINDTGEFYYRSLDTIYQLGSGTGSGTPGATGATGSQGLRSIMNLSYTGSSLTLGLGTITLPITTPINNLGWQQGTRLRVWHSATEYMEGQITSVIANPQSSNIDVNIDYVVGSGSFVSWYVGIAGDLGSGGSGGGGTQSLEQTLVIGNTIGTQSINFGGAAYIAANGTNIELKADGNVSGDLYLNSLMVADDTSGGIEQISFSDISGTTRTSNISLSPGQTYEAHTINDIVLGTQQTTIVGRAPEKTVEVVIDQSTGIDTEYRRELGVIGTTNGSSVKVTDNNSLEETEIKTDKSTITLSSSAAAGQILATIGITASEITYSIIDTDYYDPHYSAIGTIGTQFTTFGNEYISPNPGFPDFHRRGSVNTKSGPAQGNETWAELRSETTNGSSYAFIRSTDLGGAYAANILEVGAVGTDWTTIEQNLNEIKIKSSDTGFYGVQYDQDWSANFTNRTLVDKEYVDNTVSGGATGLGGVLVVGNTTDNNDIILSNSTFTGTSDNIKAFGNTMADAKFSFEDFGGGAWAPTIRTQNGNSTNYITVGDSETFIHNSQSDSFVDRYGQIEVGPTQITTSLNDLANGQGTAFVMTSTSIVVGNQATVPNVFPGIEYDIDYSANFTTRSLVDKAYVDNAVTAGGGGGTVSQILTQVRNQSGATMHRGKVVYISGSTGNLPLVTLSRANSEASSARTYGIIKDDIANNGTGYVVAIGAIQNLDTRTSATNPFTSDTLADGNRLYLSPTTAGYVTNVKPSAPNHLVYIGTVVRTSPTQGYIEYQIQNGYELDELHDVSIPTTPTNGQVLAYESATSLWKATTVSGTTPNLTQVLTQGNTASTDINMNQNQLTNVSVIDADGNVGIHTINMINASLITLMYNT